MNFCDFLFDEGHFERSILACFRFVFLYPDDEQIPLVYYRIARSYEESGLLDLAIEYFQQVQGEVGPASSEFVSAQHRIAYIRLMDADYDAVHEIASEAIDPYLIVFDGYASLSQREWEDARSAFLKAGKRFESPGYRRILRRLIRACEGASSVPKKKGSTAGFYGIFPGGGRVYQQDWKGAAGTLISVSGLGLQLVFRGSSPFSLWIPGIAVASLYAASVMGSTQEVEFSNEALLKRYARGINAKLGPENFVDFPEPGPLSAGS
ncbi:MAG: tetratricopeptide repeat protein [Candidatus Neomarinimicrobiota bacterium]